MQLIDEVGIETLAVRLKARLAEAPARGRRRVHRRLMEHTLSVRRPDAGLMPFHARLVLQLARDASLAARPRLQAHLGEDSFDVGPRRWSGTDDLQLARERPVVSDSSWPRA